MKTKGKVRGFVKTLACAAMALSLVISGPEWLDVGFVVAKAADTFTIGSYADLLEFRSRVNGGEITLDAKLTGDIVCKVNPEDEDYDVWEPISDQGHQYKGTFDGDGHKIVGLYSVEDRTASLGLFGYLNGGTVKNVTLEDVMFQNHSNHGVVETAGIAGISNSNSTVTNCTVYGEITSYNHAAGIIGTAYYGTIIDHCTNHAEISATNNVSGVKFGGITSHAEGTISNCVNTGNVTGAKSQMAGIVGELVTPSAHRDHPATVLRCTNSGEIKGLGEYDNSSVGGVVGYSEGCIEDCVNSGSVYGNEYVGGIIGRASSGTTTECANTGSITGKRHVGGIIGWGRGDITDCTNEGSIQGTTDAEGNFGGIVGNMELANNKMTTALRCTNSGTVSAPVGAVSGIAGSAGSTVIECANTGAISGTRYVSGIVGWGGNPGNATTVIQDCENSGAIYSSAGSAGGISGYSAKTISGCTNSGEVYGEGATNDDNGVGGIAGYGCQIETISNCTNTGTIKATQAAVGGIAGVDRADIINCTNEGTILAGSQNTGGMAGYGDLWNRNADNRVRIQDCTNSGTVTYLDPENKGENNQNYGGIAGSFQGYIISCTNTGEIHSVNNAGGITGWGGNEAHRLISCTNSAKVTADGYHAGGIAGTLYSSGTEESDDITVSLCSNSGEITATTRNAGGIVGNFSHVKFYECSNTGVVTAGSYAGGIGGYNVHYMAQVYDSTNTGTITGTDSNNSAYIGGIMGRYLGLIERCTNSGAVTGCSRVGGIAGLASNDGHEDRNYIKDCDNSGDVTGKENLGGIVGGETENAPDIIDCSNSGDISYSGSRAGGIVGNYSSGRNRNTAISGCTNTGDVIYTGTGAAQNSDLWAGGIAGRISFVAILNCTNSGNISGLAGTGGIMGGGDMSGNSVQGCLNTGTITGGNNTGGIAGLANTPDTTTTFSDCENRGDVTGYTSVGGIAGISERDISDCVNSGHITATGSKLGGIVGEFGFQWTNNKKTATNCTNTGNLTGNSFVGGILGYSRMADIIDCSNTGDIASRPVWHADTDEYLNNTTKSGGIVGVVGYLLSNPDYKYPGSVISGCTNEGNVTGESYLGGIAGHVVYADISSCSSSGEITGNDASWAYGIGGIVGVFEGDGGSETHLISDCTNTGAVTGVTETGGIAGDGYGGITDCVNEGQVTGLRYNIGGISGYQGGNNITGCTNSGDIVYDASVFPLYVTQSSYTNPGYNMGGIVGYLYKGRVESSNNTGNVAGLTYLGGIAGKVSREAESFVGNCTNEGDIVGEQYIGGIAGGTLYNGDNTSASPLECVNTGNVTGINNVGGITGLSSRGIGAALCRNEGTVTGKTNLGGITGNLESINTTGGINFLTECTNTGDVICIAGEGEDGANAGGIAGYGCKAVIDQCTNTGDVYNSVSGEYLDYAGGIIGRLDNTTDDGKTAAKAKVTSCSAECTVSGRYFVGGIAGKAFNAYIKDCSASGEVTATANAGGIAGDAVLTAAQPEGVSSGVESCTNNAAVTASVDYIGGIVGFCGTDIRDCVNNGSISGRGFLGGITGYINSHYLTEEDYSTILTGCLNTGTVTGSGSSVGGIAGMNHSLITHCRNTGNITSTGAYVGGIEGETAYDNRYDGREWLYNAEYCYNTGSVIGGTVVGGIAGYLNSSVEHCYNTGDVQAKEEGAQTYTAGECAGGIAGRSYGDSKGYKHITSCYNTGSVAAVDYAGGIAGSCQITIRDCYNVGRVTISGDKVRLYVGGIKGENSNYYNKTFAEESPRF